MSRARCEARPFPRERHDVVDALDVGVRRHMVHALLELDVTRARQLIREHEASARERLSFTAFVATLARAIDGDKRLHAYGDRRGRLVLFGLVHLDDPTTRDALESDEVVTLRSVEGRCRRSRAPRIPLLARS